MTNYERICADKAFCARLLTNGDEQEFYEWMKWLDTEQREVSDERRSTMSEIEWATINSPYTEGAEHERD